MPLLVHQPRALLAALCCVIAIVAAPWAGRADRASMPDAEVFAIKNIEIGMNPRRNPALRCEPPDLNYSCYLENTPGTDPAVDGTLRVDVTGPALNLIHTIIWRFGTDDVLAEDSKLGRALIARYGPPRELMTSDTWYWRGWNDDGGIVFSVHCDRRCELKATYRKDIFEDFMRQEKAASLARLKAAASDPPNF